MAYYYAKQKEKNGDQWRSYIGAFRAHALPNSLSALPLSAIILAKSGKRLMVLSEQFSP